MAKILEFRPRPSLPTAPPESLTPSEAVPTPTWDTPLSPSAMVEEMLREQQLSLPYSLVDELCLAASAAGSDALVKAVEEWLWGARERVADAITLMPTIDLNDAGDAAPSA